MWQIWIQFESDLKNWRDGAQVLCRSHDLYLHVNSFWSVNILANDNCKTNKQVGVCAVKWSYG